ncbi:MAG: hypothetical protein JHD28_06670, partial [Bacteroidia bacterium]|nr:hypothetical protein [Bacteroidia bacterium]
MKKFIIIIFSLLAIYISSCKPEPIDLLVKQSPQRYALSSQYIGNGVLGVSVSKTFEALQTKNNGIDSTGFNFDSSLLVGNAKVIIKGNNGITKELINVEKGIYVTETAEIIDLNNYTIEVFIDNKMVMNAQTNKPIKVNFDSISTYRVSNSKVVNVYYQISDNI